MRRNDLQAADTIRKYLELYAEPEASSGLDTSSVSGRHYDHSLAIPACREDPAQLRQVWKHLVHGKKEADSFVVILVINSASDGDPSSAELHRQLHDGIRQNRQETRLGSRVSLLTSQDKQPDLIVVNRYERGHTIDYKQGVGLARKIGMDIALRLTCNAYNDNIGVASDWLCVTDADAVLPDDYFQRHLAGGEAAELLPFTHLASRKLRIPSLLYDIHLLYYAAALRQAGSPYGYTTIGSTITCAALAYAQVRGCPKRNTGEDFYLLNKLAKIGAISSRARQPLLLEARLSDRVPIGTGTALARILRTHEPLNNYPFYHPDCFRTLASFLAMLRDAGSASSQENTQQKKAADPDRIIADYRQRSGFDQIYQRKRRENPPPPVLLKFLHDWFDALRTLQFVHQMRDRHFGTVALADLAQADFINWEFNSKRPLESLSELRGKLHQAVFTPF